MIRRDFFCYLTTAATGLLAVDALDLIQSERRLRAKFKGRWEVSEATFQRWKSRESSTASREEVERCLKELVWRPSSSKPLVLHYDLGVLATLTRK